MIESNATLRHQGSVQESYRTHRGRQMGPYYRIVFREGERMRSIYLGKSEELAAAVRQILNELQADRRRDLARRKRERFERRVVREMKSNLNRELNRFGRRLKGLDIRRLSGSGSGCVEREERRNVRGEQ